VSSIHTAVRLAERLARRVQNDSRFFYGAVLVKGGNVVSVGQNFPYKTNPKSNHPYYTVHAELDCLLGVDYRETRGSTLVIVRLGGNDRSRWGFAAPCEWCRALIRNAAISQVFYSHSLGFLGFWPVKEGAELDTNRTIPWRTQ
jgi:deoxycytidylate deaminase